MTGKQSTGSVRCSHCQFENLPGVQQCQVCGSRLAEVLCHRCGFSNPAGYAYCGVCGASLSPSAGAEQPRTSISPASASPTRPPLPKSEVSPIALIGFGAILALASAAYPWYLLGNPSGGDAGVQTLGTLLQQGWHLFPGIPLSLITLSTVASSMVAVLQRFSRIRHYVALISGFVTLFSAAWLWQGYTGSTPSSSESSVPPELGAALITIGAIILVVGSIWAVHIVEQGRAAKKSSDSTADTTSDSPPQQGAEK